VTEGRDRLPYGPDSKASYLRDLWLTTLAQNRDRRSGFGERALAILAGGITVWIASAAPSFRSWAASSDLSGTYCCTGESHCFLCSTVLILAVIARIYLCLRFLRRMRSGDQRATTTNVEPALLTPLSLTGPLL
jgi:hypothetical protein